MLDKKIIKIGKPWGMEEILETNEKYTVKRLTMKEGCKCSYQYHERKLETIFVLKGELIIIYEDSIKKYFPGEKGDAIYLECSTSELEDVVRIKDDYGRK